jgi:hypothetical protein
MPVAEAVEPGEIMKARFEIGENEKHIIEVSASVWTGQVKIVVDGRTMAKTHQIGLSDASYRFPVGENEKHDVEVIVGGIVAARAELLVDGKRVGTA